MNTNRWIGMALVSALAVMVCGCQLAQISHLGPETHFAYPNSNITPLGPVKASATGAVGLSPQQKDSASDLALYNAALAQVNGANVIIDYCKTWKMYGLMIIPIYWSTLEIEGTAAKMEVGKQILK